METLFQLLDQSLAAGANGQLGQFAFALLLAYFGGIVSSLTPCIYPMIPITVGFVGGAAQKSWKSGFFLSISYVLGMACIYAFLGMMAALSGKVFGTLTQSSLWYIVLGNVMIFSSLWMLDVFHFDPVVFMETLSKKFFRSGHKSSAKLDPLHAKSTEESTLIGAFILGASSGFIAAPCTTPVLAAILSFVANYNSIFMGTLLMFAFALGLGTLLVAVGTFAGALKVLPKSGQWMVRIKFASGILILILAEYYLFKAGQLK